MKYSTQHKYQCSEAYDKWALKNPRGKVRQAYMAACRTCIEGFSEWVSVDDPPKKSGAYIGANDVGGVWVYAYRASDNTWMDWDDEPFKIIEWMPLPEPPIDPTTETKTPEE